jgi:hypothetical protein
MSHRTETVMKLPETQKNGFDAQEWDRRKRSNKRLGYIFGVIVLAIFLGSIWKYRPF